MTDITEPTTPFSTWASAEIERLEAHAAELEAVLTELVNPADFDQHPNDFMPIWHKARALLGKEEPQPSTGA